MDSYEMPDTSYSDIQRLRAEMAKAMADFERRLQAVEKATLPQPYNPDEAEGGTAGGPQ